MEQSYHPLSQTASSSFDELFFEFSKATQAIQMYDLKSAEAALYQATNLYTAIERSSHDKHEVLAAKFLVDFIDVAARTIRYMFAYNEEWYSKSLEELQEAKRLCDALNAALPHLSPDFFYSKGILEVLTRFQFLVIFYNLVVNSSFEISKGHIEKAQGHFIDDVKIYKKAAVQLRQMNQYRLQTDNEETRATFRSIADFCNKTAETYERKAERLEEKRKQTEFLSPIGKEVFIVHGHDTGVLRELKEILRDMNVEPIILFDQYDDGKTVIEKFEHYGRQSALAYVMITPDDWVKNNGNEYFQPRPNVLFELGWFCGRYGRDNVRILRKKNTPLPSDLHGIITIDYNDRIEEVYRKIKTDLVTMKIIEKDDGK